MDALRLSALGGGEQLAVEAELEDEVGLGAAGELGVGDLVAVGAEVGGPIDAEEEVGVAAQPVAEEGRLVDDVGTGAQGLLGLDGGGLQSGAGAVIGKRDLDDLPALGLQRLEVASLVLVSLASQQLRISTPVGRIPNLPPSTSQVQRRQMVTGEKVVQVAGRENQLLVKYLHTPPRSKSAEHMAHAERFCRHPSLGGTARGAEAGLSFRRGH